MRPSHSDPLYPEPHPRDPRGAAPHPGGLRHPDAPLHDPRGVDPRLNDPRLHDPRLHEPRHVDPRHVDPRLGGAGRAPDERLDPRMVERRPVDPYADGRTADGYPAPRPGDGYAHDGYAAGGAPGGYAPDSYAAEPYAADSYAAEPYDGYGTDGHAADGYTGDTRPIARERHDRPSFLSDPRRRLLLAAGVALALLLAFVAWYSDPTNRARRELADANAQIVAKEREVREARLLLERRIAELRAARANADVRATVYQGELEVNREPGDPLTATQSVGGEVVPGGAQGGAMPLPPVAPQGQVP